MRISIFGLGYVGRVSAGCPAARGHDVIGIDPVQTKVDLINNGLSPMIETEIGEIIASVVSTGRLRATTDTAHAIDETDFSFVCVGTPSQSNGNLDLRYVQRSPNKLGTLLDD